MYRASLNRLTLALLTGLFAAPGCGADDMTSDSQTGDDGGPGDCEAALAKGQLVFTEIMADPKGADDDSFEWFELYNASTSELSLSGVGLEYSKPDGTDGKGHLIDAGKGVKIGAGAYMVFGKATAETVPKHVDYGYGADLSLGNTNGRLRVVCGDTVIDEALYDDLKDGYSRSFGGQPPDAIANDDLGAWCLATDLYDATDYGTPGAANPTCPLPPTECGMCYDNGLLRASRPPKIGELVISEMMPNAKLTDGTVGEWFELQVVGGPIDLNCLQYGGNTTKFLADPTKPEQTIEGSECLSVGPGSVQLFAEHVEWDEADFPVDFAMVDSVSESNPSPGIYVAYDGKIIDEAHYMKAVDGAAWSLDPDFLTPTGNDDPNNWCLAVDMFAEGDLGTPGGDNPQCPDPPPPAGTCLDANGEPRDIDYAAPGELLVTEVFTDPKLSDTSLGEWIELFVAADMDLNGITLGKTLESPYTKIDAPECLPIPAGTLVLLAKSGDPAVNGGLPTPDWVGPKIALTNDSSTLVVGVDDQKTMTVSELDAVSWANTADGKSRQLSIELITEPIDVEVNDDPAAWCDGGQTFGLGDFGTPKADNLSCAVGPMGDKCTDPDTMMLRDVEHPKLGDLLITEVHADPDALIKSGGAGEPAGEWFEFYAAAAFDLNGLDIGNTFPTKKHTVTDPMCLPVAADSYVLLARLGEPTDPPDPMDPGGNGGLPTPNYQYASLSLSNSGAGLYVGLPDLELDSVTFPKAAPGKATQLSLAAACVGPPPLEPACNDDFALKWCAASTPYGLGDLGTPQAENLDCGGGNMDPTCIDPVLMAPRPIVPPTPGSLVINEFMADPNLVTDANGEWFEVAALAPVDLNGLKILNKANPDAAAITAAKPVLVSDMCLAVTPGQFVLFAHQADPAINGGLPAPDFIVSTMLTNTNAGLTLALGDTLLHTVAWVMTQKAGKATTLDPDGLLDPMNNNADGPPWCFAAGAGTPKLENSQCP